MSLDNDQGGINLSRSNVRPAQNSQQELYARNANNPASAYEELALNGTGSFTPEGYPAFQDPFRHYRLGERGGVTPGGE